MDKKGQDKRKVLIYDVDKDTIDAPSLTIEDDIFEVVTTATDHHLIDGFEQQD